MARPRRDLGIESRAGRDGKMRYRGTAYVHGKLRRGPYGTEEAAILWREQTLDEAKAGTLVGESPTVSDAIKAFGPGIESGVIVNRSGKRFKPSVVVDYKRDLARLEPWIGASKLDELRLPTVNRVAQKLREQGLSDSTVRNTLAGALRSLYSRWALPHGYAGINPCVGLNLPITDEQKRERIAPAEECALLTAALDFPDRTAFAVAWGAGLRSGEVFGLDLAEHVDLELGVIRVERAWDPKSSAFGPPKSPAANRVVPIRKVLRLVLEEHIERYGSTGLLLPKMSERPGARKVRRPSYEQLLTDHASMSHEAIGRKYGVTGASVRKWMVAYRRPESATAQTPMSPSSFSKRCKDRWQELGLEPLGMHEARHTFASVLIEVMVAKRGGVNLKALSTLIGHASTTITLDRYGHLFPGNEAEIRDLLDGYDMTALDAVREGLFDDPAALYIPTSIPTEV